MEVNRRDNFSCGFFPWFFPATSALRREFRVNPRIPQNCAVLFSFFDAEAAALLLRADAAAGRYAGGDSRRLLLAGVLALAGDENSARESLARLTPHAELLETLPAAALADAARLAALSPALLRGCVRTAALAELPAARARLQSPQGDDLEAASGVSLARHHDLHLAALLLAEDYGQLEVAEGGARMAALADALTRAALSRAGPEETPEPLRFQAMGKWGGEELNYHSDLDLQLTGGEGAATRARSALRLLRTLGESGERLKLDLNLRPRGRDGELLLPRAALRAYLENWAAPWEIVAGLRLREIAKQAGPSTEKWLARRDEWFAALWRRRPPPAVIRSTLADFKMRLERQHVMAHGESDLKLGAGGIREVEFIAQGLLLLEGGAEDLRIAGNTWRALRRLEVIGALHSHELQLLLSVYRTLRRLENLLQVEELRQIHLLPASIEGMRRLLAAARAPGPPDASPLLQELAAQRGAVRDLFELKFSGTGRLLFAAGPAAARFPAELSAPLARALETAWARALAASPGLSLTRIAEIELALGAALAERPAAAAGWSGLLDALADGQRGLAPLAHDAAGLSALSRLLAEAPPLAALLSRQPELLAAMRFGADPLAELPAAVAARLQSAADQPGAAQRACGLSRFVSGAAVLLSAISGAAAARALAAADRAVLAKEWEDTGNDRNLCIALGALGGGGMTLRGDWDLVFIGEGAAPAELLRRHAAHTAWGKLPDLDLDLRPWGRDGEPVISLKSLADYLREKAEPYEKLAWLRAVPVAGGEAQRAQFIGTILTPLRAWRPDESELAALWRRVGQRAGQGFKTLPGGPLALLAGRQCAELLRDAPRAEALRAHEENFLDLRFRLELSGEKSELLRTDEDWRALAERTGEPLFAQLPAWRAAVLDLLQPWRAGFQEGAEETAKRARSAHRAVDT